MKTLQDDSKWSETRKIRNRRRQSVVMPILPLENVNTSNHTEFYPIVSLYVAWVKKAKGLTKLYKYFLPNPY